MRGADYGSFDLLHVISMVTHNRSETSQCASMAALARLVADRSSLIVAHRLKTVVEADEILVLDKGRIVERGTHAQLLGEGGLYGRLWRSGASGAPEIESPRFPDSQALRIA